MKRETGLCFALYFSSFTIRRKFAMFTRYLFMLLSLLVVCLSISACGGGGASDDAPPSSRQAILVNAGTDISLNELGSAELSGAASGGSGIYTFEWQVPASITIEQASTDSASAIVTAPVVAEETSYTLSLIATDENGQTGQRSITLTVLPVNELPTVVINVNQLENYAPFAFPVNAEVVLDASQSFDLDPQSEEEAPLSYEWQQVAGTFALNGVATNESQLRFMTPVITRAETAQFMLSVRDQEGGVATARQTIEFVGEEGTLAVVDAGTAISVFSGEIVSLFGSVLNDAPNAGPYTFAWEVLNNSGVRVEQQLRETQSWQSQQVDAHFVAPNVAIDQVLSVELSVVDRFGKTVTDTVEITVYPKQKFLINDTGVSTFASSGQLSNIYQSAYPGQDAQYGADALAAANVDIKTGRGDEGFDFTRLNENGDPVDDQVNNNSQQAACLRDNITGLIWELKSSDTNAINYTAQAYTWYQEEDNGNDAGAINESGDSCNLSGTRCNTQAYIDAINALGLCGFSDWRLPNHYELQSIIHYGRAQSPSVDIAYFPNTGSADEYTAQVPLWYWTRQSSADGVSNDIARNAWAIDFANGLDNQLQKTSERKVRLVRAGRGN
uniref:Lcl C-terminal domain-containing protein n=1 Tax=Ningiella ruwaisensis TaxID=2364274 RepID=UPI00109F1548|nr:DUF1566 domain-containing protein [Ningiella ruwaisensis]